jgi:hypothetical protein
VYKLVDIFVSPVGHLGQNLRKFLVVEEVEIATLRNLAHSGRMPALANVAVLRLHENTPLTQILYVHLSCNVGQPDPLPNVPAGLLDHVIAADIGEKAKTEAVVISGIRSTINGEDATRAIKLLPHVISHLVVADLTPVSGLNIGHWHNILTHLSLGRRQ